MGNEILLTFEERVQLKNIKNIMETLQLSFEKACEALKIDENDMPKYKNHLD